MYVQELWRYPVKSLGGEPLERAAVRADGIVGDRMVIVVDLNTRRIVTSRTKPKLLALKGSLADSGKPLIDGKPWYAPESLAAVQDAAGDSALLISHHGPERFDVLPLSIATDGAVLELGFDRRRLRPNILIGGVDGLAEREWPGRRLRIGDVLIDVARLRPRCVMTTYDPDTQAQDHEVLRKIVREFGGALALDCAVVRTGEIAVGDPVELE